MGKSVFQKNIYGRSKSKEANLFFPFSNLLPSATSLKVALSGVVLYF